MLRSILLFMALCLFAAKTYGEDYQKKDVLDQMYIRGDISIVDIKGSKYYLDVDRLSLCEGKMYLSSDFYGLVSISNLMHDQEGIYTAAWYYYFKCDKCGASYQEEPAECSVCGNTSFTYIENLSDDF